MNENLPKTVSIPFSLDSVRSGHLQINMAFVNTLINSNVEYLTNGYD